MIVIRNREMLIPREEYNLGTNYDNNTEIRVFHIPKITSGGVDLSNLTFTLDLQYNNGAKDSAALIKEILDECVNLQWNINKNMLQVPGTVYAQIRATDAAGATKWTSFKGAYFVEDAINTPASYTGKLTELEQLEASISAVLTSEASRVKAEEKREEAEGKRQSTFDTNEANRQSGYDSAIADFNRDRQELKDFAKESQSWAIGGTGSRPGEDTDNSKYYSEQAKYDQEKAYEYMQTAAEYVGLSLPHFEVHFDDGHVHYQDSSTFLFVIDGSTGLMNYEKESN